MVSVFSEKTKGELLLVYALTDIGVCKSNPPHTNNKANFLKKYLIYILNNNPFPFRKNVEHTYCILDMCRPQ